MLDLCEIRINTEIPFTSLYLGERRRRFWRNKENPGTYIEEKNNLKKAVKMKLKSSIKWVVP